MAVLQDLLIALGIGVLVGAERERRKAARQAPATAGLRTFAAASLLGYLAMALGGIAVLAAALACAAAFAVVGYVRTREDGDPGLTTEFALVTTVLLGGLVSDQTMLAAGGAVVMTAVLAARAPLHRLVGQILSEGELADLLLLAGATLVILPLLPDRPLGPFAAINPHSLWLVAIMILAINALGHLATRWLGARLGVPLLGLVAGFASSSATIGAMGTWVRGNPAALLPGSAAAVFSTVATFLQLAVVIRVTDPTAFGAVAVPLAAAVAAALAAGSVLMVQAWRQPATAAPGIDRALGIVMALGFAAMLGFMLVLVAVLRQWLGETGLVTAAAIGGLLDVHAAAMAVAAQVASGAVTPAAAVLPMLVAWTTSTAIKMVFALSAGPRPFGLRVAAAQALIAAAAWLAAATSGSIGS